MLKSLDLIGFKSFADKTRFDFDAGITAVIGPNGSGKSNVVDAIRWILGEQSPKSLRGKEMTDVIFNGSSHRRPLGMAEVSLSFNNEKRYIPLDSDEVVISRRVYRSGEGEYLINGNMSRLRDIRDLFLGTGVGAGAYSIIEQGKVESMLQSSTKDRRDIFEEAAGISKFKARKVETLRRLDRVEQNLVRAQDIHDEVDKQLRALRAQAGKAKKYKELADRQKEVRLSLSLADFFECNRRLEEIDAGGKDRRETLAANEQELAAANQRYLEVDEQVTGSEETYRRLMEQLGAIRERISALESESSADRSRAEDLAGEIETGSKSLLDARRLWAERDARSKQLSEQIERDSVEKAALARTLEEGEVTVRALVQEIETHAVQLNQGRRESSELLRTLTRLENEQAGLESQLSLLWQQEQRLTSKARTIGKRIETARRSSLAFSAQERALRAQINGCRGHGAVLLKQNQELQAAFAAASRKLLDTRERRTRLAGRIDALESLSERHEGLEGGVKQALSLCADGDPVWQPIVGALAECIEVDAEHADVVEIALGLNAQALVVDSRDVLDDQLMEAIRGLPGRVRILALDETAGDPMIVDPEDVHWPCVAQLVHCSEDFRPLINRLLGTTFVVDDYAAASAAADENASLRWVTPAGEVIETDGTITAGPPRATVGILSRSAELRELKAELLELDREVVEGEAATARLDGDIKTFSQQLRSYDERAAGLAEQNRQMLEVRDRSARIVQTLEKEADAASRERDQTDAEIRQVDGQYLRVEKEKSETHDKIAAINRTVSEAEALVTERSKAREAFESKVGNARLDLAIMEERLSAALKESRQLTDDLEQRSRETTERAQQLEAARSRRIEFDRRLLASAAQLAELYRQKDATVVGHGIDPRQMQVLREERKELGAKVQQLRAAIDEAKEKLHADELKTAELRLERDGLATRFQEDYSMILAEQFPADYVPPPVEQRTAWRDEVKDLREKIGKLGSVNAQAIAELDEFELRASTLHHQIDDLNNARKRLEEVIGKINEESRRMFLETFETVREHFRDLYRKLFGGGTADLLLEDETDVLETGIEIIARPPGKEPRSISLLSGGEKTMTAVALLMALFRSKPTPFCILDEVDAALDEANIGRYTEVLREFLDRSQFIIITHAKTTMANADVLHGVTQRESGVSTRISIRLEDVTEDGALKEEALAAPDANAS